MLNLAFLAAFITLPIIAFLLIRNLTWLAIYLAGATMIMGIIGIVPGVLTGIWISYEINLTTMPVTGHDIQYQIHPWLLIGALLFEISVVVVAAMIPAERAARLNLSTALQYE